MNARFPSIVFALLLLTGCSPLASAPEVSARLRRIEDERLAARRAGGPVARGATGSRSTEPGGVAPDRWALSDMSPEAADQTFAESSGEQAEKEALYLRRPPLESFGATFKRDVKHMPGDLWRDTKRVYGNPVNLAILGVTYGGALAMQETGPDDTVEGHYERHSAYNEDWADAFGALGNPGTHFATAGLMYLIGEQIEDDKTYEVGKTLFSALIINGMSTMVGQAATSDRAPNGEWGTFPSGHTSSTFVMATVLNEAYGPVAGVPLYGLGVLVGIERLNSGEHYLSDVVFGAVMGTVIGHSVASGRDPEIFGWKVLPYVDPANQTSGIAVAKTFK